MQDDDAIVWRHLTGLVLLFVQGFVVWVLFPSQTIVDIKHRTRQALGQGRAEQDLGRIKINQNEYHGDN